MKDNRNLEAKGFTKLLNKIISIRYLKEFLISIVLFYLTLIIVFSAIYYIIDSMLVISDYSFNEWIYFSLVTLTTVGYGDITPVNDIMKLMVSIEAFIGYISPSIIISLGLALIFRENKI